MNNTAQLHQLNPNAIALCALGRWIASRHWVPASGGSFSIRSTQHSALITGPGKDKSELSPQDLVALNWQEGNSTAVITQAEAALHARLYQLDPHIKAILHTHSVPATVFSRLISDDSYLFSGYALQQAINGHSSEAVPCTLAVFDNTDDSAALAAQVSQRWQQQPLSWGLLVRGQGLYVWGHSLDDAKKHLDAWQFLITCELERLKLSR